MNQATGGKAERVVRVGVRTQQPLLHPFTQNVSYET